MGYRHMVNKGIHVTGIDLNAAANEKAKQAGVHIAASVADVGAASDVLIVMVATDKQAEDVICHSGLLGKMKAGSVICIASSTSMETAPEIEAAGLKYSIGVLDTPVVLG